MQNEELDDLPWLARWGPRPFKRDRSNLARTIPCPIECLMQKYILCHNRIPLQGVLSQGSSQSLLEVDALAI
ncbi:hypothetical protein IF2G_08578 [Cordyceps javanica]|nr:hypothetical protein IF2G_08578 [Cordyceps javanica]